MLNETLMLCEHKLQPIGSCPRNGGGERSRWLRRRRGA